MSAGRSDRNKKQWLDDKYNKANAKLNHLFFEKKKLI